MQRVRFYSSRMIISIVARERRKSVLALAISVHDEAGEHGAGGDIVPDRWRRGGSVGTVECVRDEVLEGELSVVLEDEKGYAGDGWWSAGSKECARDGYGE